MEHIRDLSNIRIDSEALDALPESIAHEACAMPVSINEGFLRVILPEGDGLHERIARLRFVIDMPITIDTAEHEQLVQLITKHYANPSPTAILDFLQSEIKNKSDRFFPILDMDCRVSFSTDQSLSFSVGHATDSIEGINGEKLFMGTDRVFEVVGSLDVHYPCHELQRLLIRGNLPDELINYDSMCRVRDDIIKLLKLPKHVTYSIRMTPKQDGTMMEYP